MKQQNADLVNPSWNIYFQICLCIKVEVADSHRSGSFIKVTGITMATRQLEFPPRSGTRGGRRDRPSHKTGWAANVTVLLSHRLSQASAQLTCDKIPRETVNPCTTIVYGFRDRN